MTAMTFDVAGAARQMAREPSPYAVIALGVDPGPVPGFCLAAWLPGEKKAAWCRAYQCNADAAEGLLDVLLLDPVRKGTVFCGQIEEFRPGRGPGARGKPAAATTKMATELVTLAASRGVRLAVRHSSAVMTWASDKRLRAAGIWDATNQLVHSRAASRHALFCAVHDGGLADPLSKKAP